MNIIYTKHSEQRLQIRKIIKRKVAQTIRDPDYKEQGRHNTTIYYKNFGKNYLKIITEEINSKILIITLHWISAKHITFKKVIKV